MSAGPSFDDLRRAVADSKPVTRMLRMARRAARSGAAAIRGGLRAAQTPAWLRPPAGGFAEGYVAGGQVSLPVDVLPDVQGFLVRIRDELRRAGADDDTQFVAWLECESAAVRGQPPVAVSVGAQLIGRLTGGSADLVRRGAREFERRGERMWVRAWLTGNAESGYGVDVVVPSVTVP